MSKNLCLAAVLAALIVMILAPAPAGAQTSRVYFAGYMGLTTFRDQSFSERSVPVSGQIKADNTFSFAGAMGLRLTNNWRVEGELSYRKADLGSMVINNTGLFNMGGDIGTTVALANVYYDFDLSWKKMTPYLTAGLGVAFHSANINDLSGRAVSASDDDFNIAWQVGGGLKYRVADNMAFSGGYRYLATTPVSVQGYEVDYGSHEFRIGLEYDLPFK